MEWNKRNAVNLLDPIEEDYDELNDKSSNVDMHFTKTKQLGLLKSKTLIDKKPMFKKKVYEFKFQFHTFFVTKC